MRALHSGFERSAAAWPGRPAVEVEGQTLTYAALRERAAAIAATLERFDAEPDTPLTAVFASRSATAFAGVLGALMRGHGYVPLNRFFPSDRTREMLVRSGATTIVVDPGSAPQLGEVLTGVERSLTLVLPDAADVAEIAAAWPAHRFVGAADLAAPAERSADPTAADPDALAYVLFTSGSTGRPKGVMVAQRNVTAFVDVMVERYAVTEQDRLTQTFDMTFDLSVFDMFVAWERGACVCCPSEKELVAPARFLRESRPTIWFSVPSVGVFMKKLKMLKPGSYPSLRLSLFCGEPLPAEVARAFREAAPQSVVENLYGPTELTIACTLYRWDDATSPEECTLGIVPIGEPYPGMTTLVVDESFHEVPVGEAGELCLTGPQLTLGYLDDPEKTAAAFIVPPGRDETFYRTGDRVVRPRPGEPMTYRGRLDHQIKVLGHRVELGEVEAAIREESGCEAAVAVGWPVTAAGAAGIVAFVGDLAVDTAALTDALSARLAPYMVPREIRLLPELPVNANGKYDRRALAAGLQQKGSGVRVG